jgi:type IV pilus assembly protein PilP
MRGLALGLSAALLLVLVACDRAPDTAPSVQEYEQRRAAAAARAPGTRAPSRMAARTPAGDPQGAGGTTQSSQYHYIAEGKRDPFRSFVLDQSDRVAAEERGPLEQFDVSQLTVVAVVWGTGRARAMIEDPSGRGYIIQEGTPIGKNDGYVVNISDNSVLVEETYVDFSGEETNNEIEMRVRTMTQGG